MTLNYCAKSFNRVPPDTYSLISRARNNSFAIWSGCYTVDWAFVADESEGTHVRLEIPHHYCAVKGATN